MRTFILACLLAAAPAALATPRLPAEVRTDLALSYTPACNLCHIRGNTGAGTEITPFVDSARASGFDGDQRTLAGALATMKMNNVDSDGDGVSDIQELINGTDPNVYGPAPFANQPDPSYGCAQSGVAGLALLATAVYAGWRLRRRASGLP